MDIQDFLTKVVEMRQEQRNYFRYRTPDHLKASKKLEAEVDAEIERLTGVEAEKKKQTPHPTLF
ncbi:MAG TPA: hypothetical protein DHV48_03510 [Prolixibacteraceae bacterium]|nr:hypothetical protein [Prolixibacteraceae bacterium]